MGLVVIYIALFVILKQNSVQSQKKIKSSYLFYYLTYIHRRKVD